MPSSHSPSLSKKLLFYGLGAGAATAATSAQAVVTSTTGLLAQGNTFYLDLANNAYGTTLTSTDEFEFSLNTTSPASAYGLKVNSGNLGEIVGFTVTPTGATAGISYISKLAAGTVIGSGSSFVASINKPLFDATTATNAAWQPGSTGYVGLQFSNGGTTENGWAQLTLNNLDGSNGGAFTLEGFAVETSGGAIAAGSTTSLAPEPSTVALLVAGAAGVGVLRSRRRKPPEA